jgi:CRISPR-associated protein Csb2
MKSVRPTLLPDDHAVHYIWPLQDPITETVHGHLEVLREMAHSLFALGWGIDVAVADANVISDQEADALSGEKWVPAGNARAGLRVPKEGTLDHLIQHLKEFRERLGPEGLRPALPVSAYHLVEYRSAYSGRFRPIAAFSLLKPDAAGFRVFTVQRTPRVVEMMRGAAERAAKRAGWAESKISMLIKGHGEPQGESSHAPVQSARFAWLPLSTLETRGEQTPGIVGGIRRIIVTSFDDGLDDEMVWARRALSGEELLSAPNGTAEGAAGATSTTTEWFKDTHGQELHGQP